MRVQHGLRPELESWIHDGPGEAGLISLIDRLSWASKHLKPVTPRYRVFFDDPADLETRELVPSRNWLACALEGGILPPVETYHRDQENGTNTHAYSDPIGPMTELEALHYLIRKDLPPRIWRDYIGNRPIISIVDTQTAVA